MPFDDQVHLAGINDFPDIYAGVKVNSDGSAIVYVTLLDSAFATAIAQLETDDTSYSFSIVARSFQSLKSRAETIAGQSSALAVAGIHLMQVGPYHDPATSKVYVWLGAPTPADLATLAEAAGASPAAVTLASYPATVEAFLAARFGSGLVVQESYLKPATLRDRRRDMPPCQMATTSPESPAVGQNQRIPGDQPLSCRTNPRGHSLLRG